MSKNTNNMITIVRNELDGMYFVPTDDTFAYMVREIKILDCLDSGFTVYIRGEKTFWFRLNDCYVSDRDDCQDYIKIKRHENKLKSLYFSYTT